MGEIAARGGNSAAGLEKLVAGEALESEFCPGEQIRVAFMAIAAGRARPGMASLASIASGPRRDYLQPGLSCQRINGASSGTDARAWHGIIRGVKSLNGRVA